MTGRRGFAGVGCAAAMQAQDTGGGLVILRRLLGGRGLLRCNALLNELLGGADVLGRVDGVRRLLLLGIALVLTGHGVIHCCLPAPSVILRFQFFPTHAK
jgi:hypothetical protein